MKGNAFWYYHIKIEFTSFPHSVIIAVCWLNTKLKFTLICYLYKSVCMYEVEGSHLCIIFFNILFQLSLFFEYIVPQIYLVFRRYQSNYFFQLEFSTNDMGEIYRLFCYVICLTKIILFSSSKWESEYFLRKKHTPTLFF